MKTLKKVFCIVCLVSFVALGCTSIAKEKEIEIGDKVKLTANFYHAYGSKEKALILLHMLGRSKSDWDNFASYIKSKGYSSLAVDLRKKGNSNTEMLIQDVDIAYKYLKGKKFNKIVIIGASIGANAALNFAERNKEVSGVVLLSPGLSYRKVETKEAMKKYSGRPVLIVASYEDGYSAISSSDLDKIAKGNHKLILYRKAGHGTNMLLNEKKLKDEIYNFIKEVLK